MVLLHRNRPTESPDKLNTVYRTAVTIGVTHGVTKGVKAGNHELSQSTHGYPKCLTGRLHFCSVTPYVIPLPVN